MLNIALGIQITQKAGAGGRVRARAGAQCNQSVQSVARRQFSSSSTGKVLRQFCNKYQVLVTWSMRWLMQANATGEGGW